MIIKMGIFSKIFFYIFSEIIDKSNFRRNTQLTFQNSTLSLHFFMIFVFDVSKRIISALGVYGLKLISDHEYATVGYMLTH